ncbi:hypothetical protein [Butyrivibrio sp. MC2021]|uniref:hypothetical protein n=1 Tax=Butyrivibrio sp. MC2021 TaxID=1408306 RepID=UPI00047DCCF5|nr:hypothetical protein [Butyrivibrio sp. MC2021]
MSNKNADTLNTRFSTVLKALKNKGVSQRRIMDELDLSFITDETYFSSIKSGKRKNIPDELIKALHQKYNINPAYLKMESDCIFDTFEAKIESFMNVIDDWNVLKSDSNEYLHLTIDKNIVDLLIELYKVKKVTDDGISSFENEKESLKELYEAEPDPKEYVLIPRNNFIEIVTNTVEKEKYLHQVIDAALYSDYPSDETN